MIRKIYTTSCFLFLLAGLNAQTVAGAKSHTRMEGIIYEYGTTIPVEGVAVSLSEGLFTLSDGSGKFVFEKVASGKMEVNLRSLGMETINTTLTVLPNGNNHFVFGMRVSNFRLEAVEVVATRSKAGQSTASLISRQAIDHLQATTLKDVLQLIPGTIISNPNMNVENTISIRGSGLSNSLGASIIVDGAPISNNANLQALAPSLNGNTDAAVQYNNTGNIAGGTDTRSLSLDNIESIEIIRGIPSVEYGDLTSGAVIIKSRAGRDPLRVKFKTNPELYQGSISRGFSLGERKGTMNLSGDYLYTIKNPISSYAFYQRFAVKGLWTKTFKDKLYTNTSLDVSYGKDTRNNNPDDQSYNLRNAAQSIGFSFNTNGNLSVNAGWLKSVEYAVSGNYSDKHSWEESLLRSASSIYATTTVDGAVISNVPGQSVYDNQGNEITRILPGSENDWTTFLPNEYMSRWDIYGKEISAHAKVKATFGKQWEQVSNRTVVGVDFKTDGNRGKGKVYDDASPPLRSGSYGAYRPRPYYDIPFINQFGVFAEDKLTYSLGERKLFVTGGVRFDAINGKTVVAPRINASFDILPRTLALRGGYGITAKAPTLVYLYPEKAYYDFRLYANIDDPQDIFTLIKTHAFSTENKDLKIATNRKAELGLDLKIRNKYRLSLTAYDELIENGYSLSYDLNRSFQLIEYPQYSLAAPLQPGQTPVLQLDRVNNVFAPTSIPMNTVYEHNRGIELELDLGRFDAIRTSFYLDGAWIRNTSKSVNYSFVTNSRPGYLERNIGVFEPGRVMTESERLLTTLRMTHNIPRIGFVVTLTGQTIWKNARWSKYNTDTFSKYISYKDGRIYDYDPSMDEDPEFKYLINPINPNREKAEKAIPTLLLYLHVSKEIGEFLTASFFANNLLFSRPIYESTVNPGYFVELGEQLFFGFDIKITIR
jgi:hypothetical protein